MPWTPRSAAWRRTSRRGSSARRVTSASWPRPRTCTKGSRPSWKSGSPPSPAPDGRHPSNIMERAVIVAAVRTPIGRFLGAFADLTAAELGVAATKAALERAHLDPADVDELIYGNARQAGGGPNP